MGLSAGEWGAVRLSLAVAARVVLFGLPLAALAALLIARTRFPGRALLDALLHAPLILPPVAVGFALLLLFGVDGPLGHLLARAGVRLVFTQAGAALAAGTMAFPLMLRAVRQALDAVDGGLEDAARTLGAGPWDRLCTIVLPLAAPGLLAAAIVGFAASLGEFGAVITFAANVPGQTQTLPLAIYAALQVPGGEAAALRLSAMSFSIAVVALLAADRLVRRRVR